MLGYTDPYRIEDKTKALCYVKNSYVVESDIYSEDILRHDCHFQILPDSEKNYLFHPNPNQRKSTEDPEEDERIEKELQNEYDSYLGIIREKSSNATWKQPIMRMINWLLDEDNFFPSELFLRSKNLNMDYWYDTELIKEIKLAENC